MGMVSFVIAQVQSIKNDITRLLGRVQISDGTDHANVTGTSLDVNVTGTVSTVVTATHLDIRHLTAANDVVALKPDGSNSMPSMDVAARAGFVQPGTMIYKTVACAHGTVTADWTIDTSAATTQTAGYDFYATYFTLNMVDDSTAELAVQPIPIRLLIDVNAVTKLGITLQGPYHGECFLKFAAGQTIRTNVYLGGATNLNITCYLGGYEVAV